MQRITPIILCGGSGTRLWPVSRESMPKQFTPLLGPRSTFQEALERVGGPDLFEAPLVVTNEQFRFIAAEQMRDVGISGRIVLEPQGRDSGPAIAAAAEIAALSNPTACLLVLAADHMVPNAADFRATCAAALPAARAGRIVTFGIRPGFGSTAYGYIKPGAVIDGGPVQTVEAFVEKPDATTAARYMTEGYLWNSGNFLFRADVMLEEIARFEPDMHTAARTAVAARATDLDFERLDASAFSGAPKKSIDYAVMERSARVAVMPAFYSWSDVGTWDAVWEISEHDGNGNAVQGSVEMIDSTNSLVRSDDGVLTAVIGVRDLIVVTTSDAVLVAARSDAARVKELVEVLRARNRREASEHRRVYRPWGYYQSADVGARYQVKRICVQPGARLSLQKHFHRSEHWVVVRGAAEVTIGDDVRVVHENESIYVPIGSTHRLANPGKIPLELIEVQVGTYLGEDDIVRLDDVYRRT